jgi:hypothetical protein
MAENKTKQSKASVAVFLNAIDDKRKKADTKKVAAMMRKRYNLMLAIDERHYKIQAARRHAPDRGD